MRHSLLAVTLAATCTAAATAGGGSPCPDFPPVPAPGGTVTWTAAGSPYAICQQLTVPAGSTVLVEPGVHVAVEAGAALVVQGDLLGSGAAADPIVLTGAGSQGKVRVFGTLELEHAVIDAWIEPQDGGGAMIFRDCEFLATNNAMISVIAQPTYVWGDPALIQLDGCTFTGDGSAYEFHVDNMHVDLRDTTFTDTDVLIRDSYVRLDGIVVDGGLLDLFFLNVDAHQDVFVDNVTVMNNPATPGLNVWGANALLGPGNVFVNNLYGVRAMGLLPGSVVPVAGNANDAILAAGSGPGAVWPNMPIPWRYDGEPCSGTFPNIEPGTTVLMGPGAGLCAQGNIVHVRGLPDAPIVFEPAAGAWQGLIVHVIYGPVFSNLVIDGADFGLIATNGGARLLDSVVTNCNVGVNSNTFGVLQVAKTQFTDNVTGVTNTDTGGMWLESPGMPNAFVGNGTAIAPTEFGAETDARFNWWGDPSGPTSPDNPGGQGDAIGGVGVVHFDPFETVEPNYDDHPPVVRLKHNDFRAPHATYRLFETGSKVIIEWTADDDDQIVEQQVLFSWAGDFDDDFVHVATLPADQRGFEWTVADVPFIVNGAASFLRVTATDASGQTGFDQIAMSIPSGDVSAAMTITSDYGGQTFRSGQALPTITWTGQAGGTPNYYIMLDGDERSIGLGGGGSGSWSLTDAPFASTDTARLAIRSSGSLNSYDWTFGEYFSLRPDQRIGDAPPQVTLLHPSAGAAIEGGSVLPIAWEAGDDEGIQHASIQASYDGARTWHPVARFLPATTTSYDWQLPPSTGIQDVRVRVVVSDTRLQNSSDGTSSSFSITPGGGQPLGDVDGDGDVDVTDVLTLLASWGPCDGCAADVSGDGMVGTVDLLIVLATWT